MSDDETFEHEFDLHDGRRVVVRCRWYLSGNVPVLGPPKPKGIYCNGGVEDNVRAEVSVDLIPRAI